MSHKINSSSTGLKQTKDNTKPANHLELAVDGVTKLTVTPEGLIGDFGTGGGSKPVAFGVYQSVAQTVPQSTATKVIFGVKEYDTDNCYNTSTSVFTPSVAGIYHFDWRVRFTSLGSQIPVESGLVAVATGNPFKRGDTESSASTGPATCGSVNVKLDAGQQVMVQVTHTSTSSANTLEGASVTWFSGFLVRTL